ncbi:MAG: CBS domain-containing protein [Halioglobus sp.]|jgi:CBS domain-containing protein
MIKNYRLLNENVKVAKQELVAQMINYQNENTPVHEWDIGTQKEIIPTVQENKIDFNVGHLMSTDIFTVNENASLDIVRSIMDWNNIHHLPVENRKGNLIGIITDGILKKSKENMKYASDIMLTDLVSVNKDVSITDLREILSINKLSGVPVVRNKKLVGMITTNDIKDL